MKNYLISYDLSNDNLYENLYEAIKKYKHKSILESVWIIKTSDSIDKVLNNLKSKDFSINDKLIVIEIFMSTDTVRSLSLSNEVNTWIYAQMLDNIKEGLAKIKKLS